MTRKLLVPLTVVALCSGGVFAAIGIGGEGGDAPQAASTDNAFGSANAGDTLHRVSTPSTQASAASVAAAKKAKKPRIQYFETAQFPIAAGEGLGDTLTCLGKSRVLGGYFGAFESVDVAETFSAPESKKAWFEGITNFGGAPDNTAFIGIVCAKGVK